MKSLREENCRRALIDRINDLGPEAKARWGRMTVDQMLSHLVQANDLPFEASVSDRSSFTSRNVIRPLILYLIPIPKEVPTAAEMDQQRQGRRPGGFDNDKTILIHSIDKLGTLSPEHQCLSHPFFGPMSAKEWGILAHKHIDHHLRQFGV